MSSFSSYSLEKTHLANPLGHEPSDKRNHFMMMSTCGACRAFNQYIEKINCCHIFFSEWNDGFMSDIICLIGGFFVDNSSWNAHVSFDSLHHIFMELILVFNDKRDKTRIKQTQSNSIYWIIWLLLYFWLFFPFLLLWERMNLRFIAFLLFLCAIFYWYFCLHQRNALRLVRSDKKFMWHFYAFKTWNKLVTIRFVC